MTAVEGREIRRKRLVMRSWRRGMREMDLLLGPFAEAELGAMPEPVMIDYENLLSENDHDLYAWIGRNCSRPSRYDEIVRRIAAFHRIA